MIFIMESKLCKECDNCSKNILKIILIFKTSNWQP